MNPLREKGRTFALDMGSEGAASLQKVILKKLTEFMGDYSDDVLAQYILVLVAHGKQQAQTVKDLEAFLGDRSESFVAWLWEYLCTNLQSHISVSKATGGNGIGLKIEQADNGRVKSVQADVQVTCLENKHVEKRLHTSSNARNIPDLNDLPPKVGNTEIGNERNKGEAKNRGTGKHSRHSERQPHAPLSMSTPKERERGSDIKHQRKRHASPPGVNATRRLLQSAVREAVGPVASGTKSGSKRLRSVVSTESDKFEDTNIPKNGVMVINADRNTGSFSLPIDNGGVSLTQNNTGGFTGRVWDRLGRAQKYSRDDNFQCSHDVQPLKIVDKSISSGNIHRNNEDDDRHFSVQQVCFSSDLDERNGRAAGKVFSERPDAAHEGSKQKQLKGASVPDQMRSQHFQTSSHEEMFNMGAKTFHPNGLVKIRDPDLRQFDSSEKHAICARGEGSGSVTREQSQAQLARPEVDSHKDVLELKRRLDQIQMEMMKLRAKQLDSNKEVQGAVPSALPVTQEVEKPEDVLQSCTIFVTNIHFAATKETIMAHFAQCGKVEQVVILNDAATGKPKGSAYVEFSVKAEAERALTLNETSFYSRILKVVVADSSNIQELVACRSSIRHPSSSSFRSSSRGRFFKNLHRPGNFASVRPTYATPTKLQWKRDPVTGVSPSVVNGSKPAMQGVSVRPAVKSFTYVRNPNATILKAGCSEGDKGAA